LHAADAAARRACRFKPTYNPYTEPSMEIFHWHHGLNK